MCSKVRADLRTAGKPIYKLVFDTIAALLYINATARPTRHASWLFELTRLMELARGLVKQQY